MVAVRNSKKFEEENRPFRVDADAVIEIWNKEPIWYPDSGAYDGRVDEVNDDIDLLTSMSTKEFEEKYDKKLDYGGKVPISGIIDD